MPLRFSVSAMSQDTGGSRTPATTLWNPVAPARPIYVRQMRNWVDNPSSSTTRELALARTTTRGTPGFTITPTINNNYERMIAPPSGALADFALYTVNPTVDASNMDRMVYRGVTGNGWAWAYMGAPIVIPPGTGLAVIQVSAAALDITDWTWVWDE